MTATTPSTPTGSVQRGPLAVLSSDGKNDAYDFTHTRYPASGLGTEVPNYMIFFINTPEASKYVSTANKVSGIDSVANQNADKLSKSVAQGGSGVNNKIITEEGKTAGAAALSGRQILEFGKSLVQGDPEGAAAHGADAAFGVIGGAALGEVAMKITKKPKFNRIKEAIAIYMPDTVFHRYGHRYEEASLTAAMGDVGKMQRGITALGAGSDAFKDGTSLGDKFARFTDTTISNPAAKELAGALAEASGGVSAGFTDFLLRSQGSTLNPQVEMMYRQTDFRSFIYEFKFQPRDKSEAETIKQIITTFRRYAAPELAKETNGAYYIPPGQFDILYCFKDKENPYIGRVSSCVLEDISVNYSAAGQFATFTDGAPLDISMQLTFKEVEVITREIVDKGF